MAMTGYRVCRNMFQVSSAQQRVVKLEEFVPLSWHFTRQVFVGEKEDAFVQHKLFHKLEYFWAFAVNNVEFNCYPNGNNKTTFVSFLGPIDQVPCHQP